MLLVAYINNRQVLTKTVKVFNIRALLPRSGRKSDSYKQLLNDVFVKTRIIKVEVYVGVISRT